jgi:hypothetical protein
VLDARDLSEHAYFVVPRPDASVASGEWLDRQYCAISDSGVPVVRLVYASSVVPTPEAIVELSEDRRAVRVTLSPSYREWHDRLAREGRLAHDSRRCPELTAAAHLWTRE